MTAWWSSTTRVRKVRVRSSAALRVVAVGAALVCAEATAWEIDVMCALTGCLADAAAENLIQQAPISARQDNVMLAVPTPQERRDSASVDAGRKLEIVNATQTASYRARRDVVD